MIRFTHYQHMVATSAKLDEHQRRELNPLMRRCFGQGLSMNACLALVKQELAKVSSPAGVKP